MLSFVAYGRGGVFTFVACVGRHLRGEGAVAAVCVFLVNWIFFIVTDAYRIVEAAALSVGASLIGDGTIGATEIVGALGLLEVCRCSIGVREKRDEDYNKLGNVHGRRVIDD